MEALQEILAFLKIGLISFGGGWSIVGIIRHEVVPRWIDEEAFRSLIAIAQSTPGPIALNAATLIGWNMGGLPLAAAAAFAVSAFTKINALWAILGAGAINLLLGPSIRSLLGI